MRAGQFATLEQVVSHYVEATHAAAGHAEPAHRHASGSSSKHAERAPIDMELVGVSDVVISKQ